MTKEQHILNRAYDSVRDAMRKYHDMHLAITESDPQDVAKLIAWDSALEAIEKWRNDVYYR